MTPRSTYLTFRPTSLLALGLQKNCSLVNVHAVLVYSMYVVLLSYLFTPYHSSIQSDATRPARRKPVIIPAISSISHPPRPLPASDQHAFLRFLRKVLSSSSRVDAVRNGTDEPRDPLDVCFFKLGIFALQLTRWFPCSSLPHRHYLVHL
ncbi:hypothetical protein DFJ58DRAFT_767308 [Suillus subalutaceus]|uniref:uncharacterized protein n=1 Tax=Suillus subalutaceus TaxID=48586 RepID=UPI001B87F747|nr:uncharacterized protein DFJ58DRAFT_767308 [Suillus subalutaceus]KAG1868281.1 hypothetical protein DFJ58DRAFT_767308 [Suillus subalutaceus]